MLVVMLLASSLLAQTPSGTDSGSGAKCVIFPVGAYCQAVDEFSQQQPPRLFARVSAEGPVPLQWKEFASKAEWEGAGRPLPLALVWRRDNKTVRVAIAQEKGPEYTNYCYREDGDLVLLRSLPEREMECDQQGMECHITLRREQVYANGKRVASGGAQLDDFVSDLRPLKSEKTSVTVETLNAPEYLSVRDLPFSALLDSPKQ
jgi:hypothetical protein